MDRPFDLPVRMVERLSSYRRHLRFWSADDKRRIYSHELGALVGCTPAQVRRDIMTIGFTGSPARGYEVSGLVDKINTILDPPVRETMVLVGLGYLGRAVLKYLSTTHPDLPIAATFDIAPEKIGQVYDGCRCYSSAELDQVVPQEHAAIGIITVPAESAQSVADGLIRAGIRGILNFTPVRLRVPPEVFVEDVDISVSLEKVAFFARTKRNRMEKQA